MYIFKAVTAALAAAVCSCAAAAQTTFSPKFFPLNQYPQKQVQADLNGDGVPDFLAGSTGGGTKELLSNGNASYSTIAFPSSESTYIPLTAGDFNNDGKNDVFFYNYTGGSKLFLIGYGDGKGGFSSFQQAPNLPGIVTGEYTSIAAQTGDFNDDGRPDIAMAYQQNDNNNNPVSINVVLYLNNGSGFTYAGTIYKFAMPSGSQGGVLYDPTPEFDLLLGDYDADGHADLALRYLIAPPNDPVQEDDNLVVLYGNGAGKFTPVTVFANRTTDLAFNSADINDDGPTDLIGTALDHTVHIFYGHSNRTFSETVISAAATQNSAENYSKQIADFDGNGLKDIVFVAQDTPSNSSDWGVRILYQSKPGVFVLGSYSKTDNFNINGQGEFPFNGGFLGDYNRDMKPDVSLFLTDVAANHPDSMALMLNSGTKAYGTCAPPGNGIHVCSPGTTASSTSVYFNVSATSFYQLRKLEIWVDGVKKRETYHVFGTQGYDHATLTLPAGKHTVGVYAVAMDESMKLHTSFTVTVP
jgi:hypothetical protein